MSKKTFYSLLLVCCCLIGLTACGGGNNEAGPTPDTIDPGSETNTPTAPTTPTTEQSEPPKPITIKYYTNTAQEIIDLELDLLKEKYPHITIEVARASAADSMLPIQLVTTGYIPDFISYTIGSLWDFYTTGLLSDLDPWIKEYNFDTGRFLPNVMDSVRAYSNKQEALFLPHNLSANVLYYNKDLFDKFGVDYPTDNMSWDEVYELAKNMTRKEDDKVYKGMGYNTQNLTWKNQLLQPLVDPETNTTLINSDGWKRWVETMGRFFTIPDNTTGGSFTTTFDIAMYSGPNIAVTLATLEQEGKINWDAVSLPYFSGAQGAGTQMIAPFYAIPPTTPHAKEMFAIIDYMLSDEIQQLKARSGMVPIVQSSDVQAHFGKDLFNADSKNWQAFFMDPIGRPFQTTPYDDIAKTYIYKTALPAYFSAGQDVNTIFREAEEVVNQQIQEQLLK